MHQLPGILASSGGSRLGCWCSAACVARIVHSWWNWRRCDLDPLLRSGRFDGSLQLLLLGIVLCQQFIDWEPCALIAFFPGDRPLQDLKPCKPDLVGGGRGTNVRIKVAAQYVNRHEGHPEKRQQNQ